MAVEFIVFFSALLFFLSSCQAKPDNCSEAKCQVLPVGEGTASELRVKASEKGVRIVYLDLKFRNDNYRPLESENKFLPNRWVWANLISEPMLSLSYGYEVLSMGLLKYQTRSMYVLLEDQPSGCLANLNSSYQNKVVGRALLNMTQLNSSEPPDRNTVCFAMIEEYGQGYDDFIWSFLEGNVKFQCCEISKEETTKSTYIQCGLDVQVSGWFKAFKVTLDILTVLMMLFCPAFLLFLPDSIFSLQEECKKEERRENEQQSEDSHHRQSNQQRSRYRSTAEASVNDNVENNSSFPLVTPSIPTQSQQANFQIGEDTSNKYAQSLLYLDEPDPITFSYFLRTHTKERTELFSFHFKLAFLWYCVIPIFVYLRLVLNYIEESKVMEESDKKPKASLLGRLFSFRFDFQELNVSIALAPLILILISRPTDFLITVPEDIRRPASPIWGKNRVSVGEVMLQDMENLAVTSYRLAWRLITFPQEALARSIKFFTHWAIEKMGPPRKRAKTPFIALWVIFWNVVLVIVVGIIFGGICLCLLLLGLVCFILLYSPSTCLILSYRTRFLELISYKISCSHTQVFKFSVVTSFLLFSCVLVWSTLAVGSVVGGMSCRYITLMCGLVTLGLVLNVSIVGPFLALLIVALTNIYLCYYNLQMRYQDVKKMISEKWQTYDGKSEHGAIPGDLFWRICGGASNSNNTVPQVRGEVSRMLCNMAIILIFLFLIFCSVFLMTDAKSISAVPSTIAVFLSGAITGLFFKGFRDDKRFTGETRVKMIREIEEAVIEYKENTAVELYNL